MAFLKLLDLITLREKYPYSELFWSLFSRIWTEYWEILRISRIQSECRKMRTRITQNTVTLYAVLGNLRHVFFEHYNCFVNFIDFRASVIFVKFGSGIQMKPRVLMGQLLKWDEVWKCLFALHEKITFCAFLAGSGLNNIFPIHCVKYRNFT